MTPTDNQSINTAQYRILICLSFSMASFIWLNLKVTTDGRILGRAAKPGMVAMAAYPFVMFNWI
jgi:hypothetical protein